MARGVSARARERERETLSAKGVEEKRPSRGVLLLSRGVPRPNIIGGVAIATSSGRVRVTSFFD